VSDLQLAVLLAALAGIAWYVRGSLERESGPSGLLESRAAPVEGVRAGLYWLLLGHAANLIISIPLLASPPLSMDEGHSILRWLAEFVSPWLRWVGLTQFVYLGPLWKKLQDRGRPEAARAMALSGGATLAASGLAWSVALQRRPGASFSLQAACGLMAMACAVALLWLTRELRRRLKGY